MVETSSLLPVAEVLKLFGNNGTLIVKFHPNALSIFKETEPVFALMDAIPVPFFISAFQRRGNDRAHILFDTIYREAQALELVGKTLYQTAPAKIRKKSKQQLFKDPNLLVGFTVSDIQLGPLGCVEAFIDWRMNPCLSIRRTDNSSIFLVPLQEAFISKIDAKSKHIIMSLPEGLTEV